jgi:hypothetical protein
MSISSISSLTTVPLMETQLPPAKSEPLTISAMETQLPPAKSESLTISAMKTISATETQLPPAKSEPLTISAMETISATETQLPPAKSKPLTISAMETISATETQLPPAKSKPLTILALPREVLDMISSFSCLYGTVVLLFPFVCKQWNSMKVFPSNRLLDLRKPLMNRLTGKIMNGPGIKDLHLHAIIDFVVQNKKNVTAINLQECCELTNDGTIALSKVKNLAKLNLAFCHPRSTHVPFTTLDFLSELTNLKELNLFECRKLKSIQPIGNLTKLRKLDLTIFEKATDFDGRFEALGNLKKLRELRLDGRNIVSLECLSNAVHLRILSLNNCEELVNIDSISNMKKLERVNLAKCKKIGSFLALDSLPSSTTLVRPPLYKCETEEEYWSRVRKEMFGRG